MIRLGVVGTGYVGLVAGACFAEFGSKVTCIDKNEAKIRALQRGNIPMHEPGLDRLVATNVDAGRLNFTVHIADAVAEADAVFLAVGTPSASNGDTDFDQLFEAIDQIAAALGGYSLLVTKSTVPVGTGRMIEKRIRKARPELDFDAVSNPEFLREGTAIHDFMNPARIVIGTDSPRARALMRTIYLPLEKKGAPTVFTTLETAELLKYACNAFLAAKLAFINEIADLAEVVGADIGDVALGMGLDPRIGSQFMAPGPGYGGSCLPKDTMALRNFAQSSGKRLLLAEAAIEANEERKKAVVDRIAAMFGGELKGVTVAILGVAFKAGTDDVRDSPSLSVINSLQTAGASVRAYDPAAMHEAKRHLDDVYWALDAYDASHGADIAVILTEWNEFRELDVQRLKARLRQPQMLDMRNLFEPTQMAVEGLDYVSLGRAWISRFDKTLQAAK